MADSGMIMKADSLIDSINSPEVHGVIPGSIRVSEDVRRVDAKLAPSRQFLLSAGELDMNGALVGSKCELVVVATAKKSDGTDIASGDNISLREEASNLVWRDLTLMINGTDIAKNPRADIVRHVIDRYHDSTHLIGSGLCSFRQLGPDTNITLAAGAVETGVFKQDMIYSGRRFELIRPLDDMPMFAEGDSLVPGFNVIQIRAITTPNPQVLFKTTDAVTAAPYLQVEEVRLRYTTVKLEPEVAQSLQQLSSAGQLELNGSLWSANNLTPIIDSGAKSYSQGTAVALGTAPDVAYFMAFPQSSFIPSMDAYSKGEHPLTHAWNFISTCSFLDGSGHTLRQYFNLDSIGGKVQTLNEMRKSLSTQGGFNGMTGALTNVSSVDPTVFAKEKGLGAVPLYMRNWAEANTHEIAPVSIRMRAELNDPAGSGAAEKADPYLVTKSRHRWVLSTVPNATKIVI